MNENLRQVAVTFIKEGRGRQELKELFNAFCEDYHANGGRPEVAIDHRKIVAQRVVIDCIRDLTWAQQEELQKVLYQFSEDYPS